jgi:hypothetical protein
MKEVIYRDKRYQVLEDKFIGNANLYKLASRFSGGAPFPASKMRCSPIRKKS